MCDPTTIVLGGIAIGSAVYGGVSTKYYKDKEIGETNKANAEQEKLVKEATPTEVQTETVNKDRVKKLNKLRTGIRQNVYSDGSNMKYTPNTKLGD